MKSFRIHQACASAHCPVLLLGSNILNPLFVPSGENENKFVRGEEKLSLWAQLNEKNNKHHQQLFWQLHLSPHKKRIPFFIILFFIINLAKLIWKGEHNLHMFFEHSLWVLTKVVWPSFNTFYWQTFNVPYSSTN